MGSAQASEERPHSIVCTSLNGLQTVLNLVESARDIVGYELSRSELRRQGDCYYTQLERGTEFVRRDYFQSRRGFIFSVFELRFGDSRRYYTTNSVYLPRDFRVQQWRGCISGVTCTFLVANITRRNCSPLMGGFVPEAVRQQLALVVLEVVPEYVLLPPWCEQSQFLP
jgi:hypothetical protein